jgi:hypothetical protein
MPPPDAVRAGKVRPLSDEDTRTLVRWIDLGCPIDLDKQATAKKAGEGSGWFFDDQRPALTLTYPRAGANEKVDRILVGMYDYYTGLDMESFQVIADFPVAGVKAGINLAPKFTAVTPGVWELRLPGPLPALPRAMLTVSVRDRQGNVSRIERIFSVGDPRSR